MKQIRMSLLVIMFLFTIGMGNSFAQVGLPTTNFSGNVVTTATIGTDTGYLELVNTVISQANYLDGTSTVMNTATESIIGMTVTISGASRTGDYTFSDAVITVSDGSFNYLSATVSNLVFVTDGVKWYLNPGLDINNPSTLNITNIVLSTDATHPSRYIDELILVKGAGDTLGMKMILQIFSGSITGDSDSDIFTGLLDGSPPVVDAPSGARTIGYWKNHDEERDFFIYSAVSMSSVFYTIDELNFALSKNGKKNMTEKARQQLSALLLNLASSLAPSTVLSSGELQILQMIVPTYDATATVGEAKTEIENAINGGYSLEDAKDLADEINNRDHKS